MLAPVAFPEAHPGLSTVPRYRRRRSATAARGLRSSAATLSNNGTSTRVSMPIAVPPTTQTAGVKSSKPAKVGPAVVQTSSVGAHPIVERRYGAGPISCGKGLELVGAGDDRLDLVVPYVRECGEMPVVDFDVLVVGSLFMLFGVVVFASRRWARGPQVQPGNSSSRIERSGSSMPCAKRLRSSTTHAPRRSPSGVVSERGTRASPLWRTWFRSCAEMFFPLFGTGTGLQPAAIRDAARSSSEPLGVPGGLRRRLLRTICRMRVGSRGSDEDSFADRPQQFAFQFLVGPVCGDGGQRRLLLMREVFVRDALVKPLDYFAESVFEAVVA